jgi:hypothetical protein
MTTIKLKNGSGAPTAGDLVQGEPALDLTNKRLYTEDSGGTVIEVGTNPGTDVTFADNIALRFGSATNGDLVIKHDGSDSSIVDRGDGDLLIQGSTNVKLQNFTGSKDYFVGSNGGASTVYYDGSQKLVTTSTGIDVTGTVTADGLTVDGSATIQATSSPAISVIDTTNNAEARLQAFNSTATVGTQSNHSFSIETNDTTRALFSTGGDISFYEDTGTTAKLFWDASAESLSIGTSSVAGALHVEKGNNYSGTDFEDNPHLLISNGTPTNHTAVLMFQSSGADVANKRSGITGGNYYSNKHGLSFLGDLSGKDRSATPDMFIDSDGNVGIGTTSPSAKLDIVSGTGYSDIAIEATGGFKARGDGRVDVGEPTGANSLLSVQRPSGSSITGLAYLNDVNNSTGLQISTSSGAVNLSVIGSSAKLNLGNTGVQTQQVVLDTSSGQVGIGTSSPSSYGHSLVVAKDASGGATYATITNTNANQFLNLGINADVAEITWDNADSLAFGTTAASTDEGQTFEAMRIDSSGNVGIGTNSPNDKVDISGSTGDGYRLTDGTHTGVYRSISGGTILKTTSNHALLFGTNDTERMRIDSSGNLLVGTTTTPTSSAKNIVLANGTAPTASATDGVILYAEDVSSSSELKVRDEAGNITTLSPHNFDLIPQGPSEDMAWSYYSERDGKQINVDMLKAIRVLEKLSGEQLVFEN